MVNAYQGLGHHFKSVPNYLQRKGQVIKITQPKLYLLTHLLRQCLVSIFYDTVSASVKEGKHLLAICLILPAISSVTFLTI